MYSAGKLVHCKENNKVAERTAMRFTTDFKIFCERMTRDCRDVLILVLLLINKF